MPLNQNNIRIVVTGMGAVTPIGTGVDTYWNNLTAGVSGIAPITGFDASQLPVRFAGEVRDFDAEAAIPKAYIKNLAPFGQYAFAAAQEALDMSGMEIEDVYKRQVFKCPPERPHFKLAPKNSVSLSKGMRSRRS